MNITKYVCTGQTQHGNINHFQCWLAINHDCYVLCLQINTFAITNEQNLQKQLGVHITCTYLQNITIGNIYIQEFFYYTGNPGCAHMLGHYSMWPVKSSLEDMLTKEAALTVLVVGWNVNRLRCHHQDYNTLTSLPVVAITDDLLHFMRLRQKLAENYGKRQWKPCFMTYGLSQEINR